MEDLDELILWGLVAIVVTNALQAAPAKAAEAVTDFFKPKPPPERITADEAKRRGLVDVRRYADVLDLATEVGFPDPKLAAAIACAESRCVPTAETKTDREWSVGLWQINMRAHPEYSRAVLLDPEQNARAALRISKRGQDWSPWSVYQHGTYQRYLQGP